MIDPTVTYGDVFVLCGFIVSVSGFLWGMHYQLKALRELIGRLAERLNDHEHRQREDDRRFYDKLEGKVDKE